MAPYLEMRAGFEPANNSFADCPLEPGSDTASYLAGIAGLEPAMPASKTGALPLGDIPIW